MRRRERMVAAGVPSGRAGAWAAALLLAVLAWTSLGHHRVFLGGDEGLNFRQHQLLADGYFEANLEALAGPEVDGEEAAEHVRLLEGGFPFLLYLAGHLGVRVPYLVNALLLPLLLFLFGLCVWASDPQPGRRLWAAELALLALIGFPFASGLVWRMALPFRDTLSHVLGFGGLAALHAAARRPERAGRRALAAGVLIGLCGWARLSGFLFAVPAGIWVLTDPAFGAARNRFRLLAAVALGVSVGLALVAAQNVFEGRNAAMPPQADKLVLQSDIRRGSEEGIRRGLHPLNLPHVLPKVAGSVRVMFPDGLHLVFLTGLAGWAVTARRQARRILPLASGLAIYLLFYGCYDKVLTRYLVIMALFYAGLAGVGAAWWLDMIWKGLERIRRLPAKRLKSWTAPVLALAASAAALTSGPDLGRANGEWRDARRFQAWLEAVVPDGGMVWSNDQRFDNWIAYFGGTREPWPMNLLNGRTIDPFHVRLPEDRPAYILAPYLEDSDDYFRGWTHDALLNRFDLDPAGPPVEFEALPFAGARLFRVSERSRPERAVEVAPAAGDALWLYLFVRAMAPGREAQEVELAADGWPRERRVELRPGVNLLAVPQDWTMRPETIRLRGDPPPPSVLEAAWIGEEPVAVPLTDDHAVASRMLQVDGCNVEWKGYLRWWRDWNDFGEPFVAMPRAVPGPEARIRLPQVDGAAGRRIAVRLFLSAQIDSPAALERAPDLRFRTGETAAEPVLSWKGRPYAVRRLGGVDFVIDVSVPGASANGWLEMEPPPPGPGKVRHILHRVDFRLLDEGEDWPPPAPGAKTSWLRYGFPN